ncbi:MAG: serine--tRNA ligase [Sedimentisphaerales bacterium]|nr:serine--tRNA ligase [Sedimentisphaerales bacterium]
MVNIKDIRENPERFKKAAIDKRFDVDIDRLLAVDAGIQENKKQLQDITTEINRIGKSVPKLAGAEKQEVLAELSELKQKASVLDGKLKELQPEFDNLILLVAQPTDDDVPIGKDDTENVEIRREGTVRQFDFEPKDHVQLGKALDIIDIERGVRLAGTRNYFLKGDGALLHWAVLRFAMDFMVGKGFVPMSVPILMKDEAMTGTGFFPGSEDQTYRMEADQWRKPSPGGLNLAGTAEVPLTAYRMGEILKADELPLKFVAMSTCFRREAGAAGKDTYGLYRIHQFDKIEQVIICENSVEASNKFHEEILANSEAVMKALELPYRVVNVCTGDLGRGQVKKFDIETWMPSRKNYCETHSASKFYEFQARRMNLRYKESSGRRATGGGTRFCHTLNNTVIASPRILIPILELYQNADGSVTIPKVLQPYMNGREKIVKREE